MDKKLFEQAKSAKSAEELMSLAKTAGVDMSEEHAEHLFGQLNRSGELSDDELNSVAGGGCQVDMVARKATVDNVQVGDRIRCYNGATPRACFDCGNEIFVVEGFNSDLVRIHCESCGRITYCANLIEERMRKIIL